MDDETLHTDYALLKDCAELDELIGYFTSKYRYSEGAREHIVNLCRCMSPAGVRLSLVALRELQAAALHNERTES